MWQIYFFRDNFDKCSKIELCEIFEVLYIKKYISPVSFKLQNMKANIWWLSSTQLFNATSIILCKSNLWNWFFFFFFSRMILFSYFEKNSPIIIFKVENFLIPSRIIRISFLKKISNCHMTTDIIFQLVLKYPDYFLRCHLLLAMYFLLITFIF